MIQWLLGNLVFIGAYIGNHNCQGVHIHYYYGVSPMELVPRNHDSHGPLGSNSIMVVSLDPLGKEPSRTQRAQCIP